MNLLLVEDDKLLGDGIQVVLNHRGLGVDWVQDGLAAVRSLSTNQYDVVVLDLNIPWLSGYEVLTRLRSDGNMVPVLVLTARSQVVDRVQALDSGADDCMIKPFDVDELCARIRALHRRNSNPDVALLHRADLVLDPAARTVTVRGEPVTLSAKEFDILHSLMLNMGRVMSRQKLEETLYCLGEGLDSNAIDVHIHHLRKKLGESPIRTVRGVGYIIEKPK